LFEAATEVFPLKGTDETEEAKLFLTDYTGDVFFDEATEEALL